jgi:hypothetical protein
MRQRACDFNSDPHTMYTGQEKQLPLCLSGDIVYLKQSKCQMSYIFTYS